jgi:hypothetical protein
VDFASSSARHCATAKSPFSLVYKRNPDLPISIALTSPKSQVDVTTTFLKSLHSARPHARDFLSFAKNNKPFSE